MARPLPIGISDFKKVIEEGYAYIDKTLLIQELIEDGTNVALIPRLRRFGKTLNLSMLRYYFEKTSSDTSHLFSSLNIWKNPKYRELQGQFPVIFISLKDLKHSSWEQTLASFRQLISKEFDRHNYLNDEAFLSPSEKERYNKILFMEGDQSSYEDSIRFLSELLHRYHSIRAILLIDEYDTPAHSAYMGGFYNELISFLRNWLSASLKDNSSLERGVLTGILRIAKESIFSGLNNIFTFTILNETFQDKFGLLEPEVKSLLEEYDLLDQLPQIREWYDGYRIGSCEGIYNPWSVLSCIREKGRLAPYWVNTSDNALMKQLIASGSDDLKADIEDLLKNQVIEKNIEDGIIFTDLERSPESVWTLLLFSGYLSLTETPSYGKPCKLRIPNVEVAELYRSTILDWFKNSIHLSKYNLLLKSLISGDIDTFSRIFGDFMVSSVSIFDTSPEEPEKIYHAFVLGMLLGLKDSHEVKSNRESGYGRYDVMLIPKNKNELGIIMEFKKITSYDQMNPEEAAASALKQIEEKNYRQDLIDRGICKILYLGLAFKGKQCCIRSKMIV